MWFRLAAVAVLMAASCAQARAQSSPLLSLEDAMERVAQSHPRLRLFELRRQTLAAEQELAVQTPPWMLGAEVENALGSGSYRGFDGADLTLSLASVFERGGKLDARRALAQSRIDGLSVQREMQRLDVLAEVARRYLAVGVAQQQQRIAERDIAQRRRALQAARQRLQAGASPASVMLTAQAALARAELDRDRALQQQTAARQYLAALWGDQQADFRVGDAGMFELPSLATLPVLVDYLQQTPELARFASDQRIGEARLQLARSQRNADWQWMVGARSIEGGADVGLLASVSVPLASASRAQPGIRLAESELAQLQVEREASALSLYSTLVEAHGRYQLDQREVARLQQQVLPAWEEAAKAAERAYRAGAASSLEWAQLQSELIQAQRQQLAVASDAHAALIEIQRLTGQPMLAGPQEVRP
ncbi:TolC family protein [Pseudoxanthomonas dokdonensis]|uniref:Cation transporter n=1 Tax=Pseudoxanthomonas dokdonensis TaxID=344882 RepID=A0A0R0CEV0_9GAMM|nr:TolC family protein [Pseudoxanthomonas dokdonensis]KRG68317.1 cation transporter [Pseudoxanthomonas dokdonensis]